MPAALGVGRGHRSRVCLLWRLRAGGQGGRTLPFQGGQRPKRWSPSGGRLNLHSHSSLQMTEGANSLRCVKTTRGTIPMRSPRPHPESLLPQVQGGGHAFCKPPQEELAWVVRERWFGNH